CSSCQCILACRHHSSSLCANFQALSTSQLCRQLTTKLTNRRYQFARLVRFPIVNFLFEVLNSQATSEPDQPQAEHTGPIEYESDDPIQPPLMQTPESKQKLLQS